jgi:hypothetical protein
VCDGCWQSLVVVVLLLLLVVVVQPAGVLAGLRHVSLSSVA